MVPGRVENYLEPEIIIKSENKAKAISAKLIDLNFKVNKKNLKIIKNQEKKRITKEDQEKWGKNSNNAKKQGKVLRFSKKLEEKGRNKKKKEIETNKKETKQNKQERTRP